jgi:hypothetical protein
VADAAECDHDWHENSLRVSSLADGYYSKMKYRHCQKCGRVEWLALPVNDWGVFRADQDA